MREGPPPPPLPRLRRVPSEDFPGPPLAVFADPLDGFPGDEGGHALQDPHAVGEGVGTLRLVEDVGPRGEAPADRLQEIELRQGQVVEAVIKDLGGPGEEGGAGDVLGGEARERVGVEEPRRLEALLHGGGHPREPPHAVAQEVVPHLRPRELEEEAGGDPRLGQVPERGAQRPRPPPRLERGREPSRVAFEPRDEGPEELLDHAVGGEPPPAPRLLDDLPGETPEGEEVDVPETPQGTGEEAPEISEEGGRGDREDETPGPAGRLLRSDPLDEVAFEGGAPPLDQAEHARPTLPHPPGG